MAIPGRRSFSDDPDEGRHAGEQGVAFGRCHRLDPAQVMLVKR
jgi:hypothetical protein